MIGAAKCAMMASVAAASLPDPSYANVTSLLHFDGADGSSTFTDQKGITYLGHGSPTLSATTKKFGTAAANLSNGSSIYTTGIPTAFAPGTGDFTVELWYYVATVPDAYICLFDTRQTGVGFVVTVFQGSGPALNFIGGSTGSLTVAGPSLTVGWHHFALVRQSGTVKMYQDGTQTGSGADTTNYTATSLYLGAGYNFGSPLNGYIDDFRWTNGVARYTANFTPPTAAFPNS